eukprot:CAMPEP_0202451992 /NCGR_PEP_ID=MMETSP1360-20130828/10283_1 /ASSEMBLY_ACC=CAM_ASM_000848 /TAXON_ID=515479 /ORGANISM="Licmophora paradoxa, Strain CCMP2313" /LENGTH=164 /DNA_ID=CAMNT_0049070681 /DNA_START=35 /DNA_END=530 /DNA_ORIENTATION=-
MASRKVPDHVARELLRHVAKSSPKKKTPVTPSPSPSSKAQEEEGFSRSTVLMGCLGFLGLTSSIPFLAMQWIGGLNDRDEALSAAQIRRGAFNNSGSKDAGKDPNWDFANGVYKKDEKLQALFARDNPQEMELGEKYYGGVEERKEERRKKKKGSCDSGGSIIL